MLSDVQAGLWDCNICLLELIERLKYTKTLTEYEGCKNGIDDVVCDLLKVREKIVRIKNEYGGEGRGSRRYDGERSFENYIIEQAMEKRGE